MPPFPNSQRIGFPRRNPRIVPVGSAGAKPANTCSRRLANSHGNWRSALDLTPANRYS